MSRVCAICGKRKSSGNNVTFSHRGIRRYWTPNLRKVRVYDEKGNSKRMYVCTRCLRSGKVNRSKPVKNVYTDETVVEETLAEEVVTPADQVEMAETTSVEPAPQAD